ncbi:MAG: hypothetical protein L0216_14300, partial [Planctomycetales bacterium]|nr:hypothetical protein [Planctomycetales bacterium]
ERASMVFGTGALSVALLGAAPAGAQDLGPARAPTEARSAAGGKVGLELSGGMFASALDGIAIRPILVHYDDIFRTGEGLSVEARLPVSVARRGVRELALGPSLLFDRVSYAGRRSTDIFGDSYEPREMDITRLLAGFHLRGSFGPFFLQPEFALGLAHIGDVGGVLDLSGSGGGVWENKLYDETWTFSTQLTLRLGFSIRADPGTTLSAYGFLGYAVVGAPDDNEDPDNPTIPADPGDIGSAFAGFGFSIRFGGAAPSATDGGEGSR